MASGGNLRRRLTLCGNGDIISLKNKSVFGEGLLWNDMN